MAITPNDNRTNNSQNSERPDSGPENKKLKIICIILNTLILLLILPWPLIAFVSLFAFDAPGSDTDPMTWIIFIAINSYPIWLFLITNYNRQMIKQRKYFKVIITSLIVLLPLSLSIVLID